MASGTAAPPVSGAAGGVPWGGASNGCARKRGIAAGSRDLGFATHPDGGTMWTMLPHLGHVTMSPITDSLRTANRR